MKNVIFPVLLLLSAGSALAQARFPKNEVSINGFRNPSIGLEYHHYQVSVHAGYYTTAFKKGEYTNFIRTGISYWFAPTDNKEIPSSFYAGVSYLRGLTRSYKDENAFALEGGYRWMAWKGLNVRIGIIALASEGKSVQINPTPGISYSFKF
jgi:hypothetical protein